MRTFRIYILHYTQSATSLIRIAAPLLDLHRAGDSKRVRIQFHAGGFLKNLFNLSDVLPRRGCQGAFRPTRAPEGLHD